jgi:putative hydroxymethylpyrimidine transport system substrate-binding protein
MLASCRLRHSSLALALPAKAQDRLTVLLDWFVNPDHAPLIIARDRGIFEAHGLEVTLIAPADPNDPPKARGRRHRPRSR